MDDSDYFRKVEAYRRAHRKDKTERHVYRPGDMEIRMPLGCWVWLGALSILVVYGMSRC